MPNQCYSSTYNLLAPVWLPGLLYIWGICLTYAKLTSAPGRIRTCDPRIRSPRTYVLACSSVSVNFSYLCNFRGFPCSVDSILFGSVLAWLHYGCSMSRASSQATPGRLKSTVYLSDLILRTTRKSLPQDNYAFTSSGDAHRSPLVRIGASVISGSFSPAFTILRRRQYRSSLETSRYALKPIRFSSS